MNWLRNVARALAKKSRHCVTTRRFVLFMNPKTKDTPHQHTGSHVLVYQEVKHGRSRRGSKRMALSPTLCIRLMPHT